MAGSKHDIVIVGGGAGGIAVAASLLRRRPGLDVAIVEPSTHHFYQPGWTMVGGGLFDARFTKRREEWYIPRGACWIKDEVIAFEPASNRVKLKAGGTLGYNDLVVATGLKLDWRAIAGLEQTLGRNRVTSNYRYDLAPYTWHLTRKMREGRAIFTQPPMPIKCAGAPQKAMYLSCDEWRRRKVLGDIHVEFHTAGPALFGVADYVPALSKYVEDYGIALSTGSNLIAVDGPARKATFKGAAGEVTREFDMLHVVPPQSAPDVVSASPLANAAGWVEVDDRTLQHKRFANVFAVGDCGSMPNAKTAGAVRKQAPVVAVNLLTARDGVEPYAFYDGYGSCPLTVERGKVVLAEFGYGGKLLPSFPWAIDPTRPSRLAWILKSQVLPFVYWNVMLKGREWLAEPDLDHR